jgi:hypothetical protein
MTHPARIPADVNRPDRVVGPFTARQSVILAAATALLYGAWLGLRAWVPLSLFLTGAVPLGALAVAVAVGQRDGLPLDQFLLAALRHVANPRRVPAPTAAGIPDPFAHPKIDWDDPGRRRDTRRARVVGERPGPSGLLAAATTASLGHDAASPGVLDLGAGGLVAVAVVSTLDLRLRTPAEQDALLAGFARYLHTLTGPVQLLIRTVPVSLTGHLGALQQQARGLPHPALVLAALAHRAHLAHLADPPSTAPASDAIDMHGGSEGRLQGGLENENTLRSRQVLLALREPGRRGGAGRLLRRLDDATRVLAGLDITVTPLPAAQLRALLSDYTNPDDPDGPSSEEFLGSSAVPVPIVRTHPEPATGSPPIRRMTPEPGGPSHDWPRVSGPWSERPPAPRRPGTPGHPLGATVYREGIDVTLADDLTDDDVIDDDVIDDGGELGGYPDYEQDDGVSGGAESRWWAR